MKLTFVTSNKDKLAEAKEILGDIESQKIELPELQGTIEEIAKQKAKIATEKLKYPCIIDDTGLSLIALGGMPGPYIKHFLDSMPLENIPKLLDSFEDKSAKAICAIGYAEPGKEPLVFIGETNGEIVASRGIGFGWDPIFLPNGKDKTYAEMTPEEKNRISHRKKALEKLEIYLSDK